MIHFTVTGQRLMASTPIIVAGTYNYLTAEFTFSADWTAAKKIAHFELGDELHDIELHDDKIVEADGLNLPAGDWSVSVTGWIIDAGAVTKQITTSSCIVRVVGKNPGFAPIEPSLAERIAAEAMEARTGAEEARHAAEAARDEARSYVEQAKTETAEIVRQAQEAVSETIATGLAAAETELAQSKDAAIADITTAAGSQRENIAAEGTRQIDAVVNAGNTAAKKSQTAQSAAEAARDAAAGSATSAAQSAQTAETKAQEIADSAGQIEQNKTDITQLKGDVTGLETRIDNIDDVIIETVEPLQKQADRTERSLNALWKLNEGQTYDIEQIEESGMNNAPTGAKFMSPEEVYGKTEQETTNGYNLFDVSWLKEYVSVDGQLVTITADSSDVVAPGGYNTIVPTLAEFPSGTYNVKSTNPLIRVTIFVENNGSMTTIDSVQSAVNFPAGALVKGVRFRSADGSSPMLGQTLYIMLEAGSVAHDWEPFTGNIPAPNPDFPEPIHSIDSFSVKKTGKNLLDYRIFDKKTVTQGVTAELNDDGTYHIYGTATGNVTLWAFGSYERKTAIFTLPKGTYYLSSKCVLYDYTGDLRITKQGSFTLTEPFNVTGMSCYGLYNSVGKTVDLTVYPQLEYGSTATAYEPYVEPITRTITPPRPLNAIGNFHDMLSVDSGEWKYRNQVLDITADEKLSILNNLNDTTLFKIEKSLNIVESESYSEPYLCDTFTSQTASSKTDTIGSYVFDRTLRVRVSSALASTVDEFKDWLRLHPIKLVYPMETPETLPADPADLDFLRSLAVTPATDHIIITDQDGNDIPWLNEYIISLREVVSNV